MAFVQYGTTAVVAVNRMSIVLRPSLFEKKWMYFSYFAMVILSLGPFYVTHPVFQNDAYFKYNAKADRFELESKYTSFPLFNALFPFMISTTVITAIANAVSIFKFRKLHPKPRNLEYNFFTVTAVASIVQVLGTGLTAAMKMATPNSNLFRMTNLCLPFVSDALSLIQPYLLLIFCEGIRKRVGHILTGFNCFISRSTSRVAVASIT